MQATVYNAPDPWRSSLRFAPAGMRQLSGSLLNLPYALLRGEPGVRDGFPLRGTAQLPH